MPCGIPRSLLLVWVRISRRWARNSEPQALAAGLLDDRARDHGFARRGRRDQQDPALSRLDRAPEFGDHLGLVRAQHLGHGAPRDLGCCIPAPRPTADGGVHALPAVVSGEAVRDAGPLQRRDHLGLVELAAGDQLKQVEGCAVERVRCGEPGGVAGRASEISARRAAWP